MRRFSWRSNSGRQGMAGGRWRRTTGGDDRSAENMGKGSENRRSSPFLVLSD
ncbi:hypothetical protein COCNU_07G001000 [Cocos nucifera]|uniref:Uncharacterized protein n=1 Tax=Cocos nucifera TaxID=13894 RepID=A0A8K0N447_COCNU|nr:hypothetical protein COCNU_07G001000 [Cocos nucifera]